MAGSTAAPRIPLPKGWPQTIRSAVIHTISLAQFSLTHTRSWAANSWNARIRLKQENDRLRQEVSLLIEEMRIKDARMLRIPAQRRPHLSADRAAGHPGAPCCPGLVDVADGSEAPVVDDVEFASNSMFATWPVASIFRSSS